MHLTAKHRVAILLHQGIRGHHGKTGLAFLRYSQTSIVGVIDAESAGESLRELTGIEQDTPIVKSVSEVLTYNPDVLLIGIAPSGGKLPPAWQEEISLAIAAGLSVVNGLHTLMASAYSNLQPGQWIWDIRQEPPELTIGSAQARSLDCARILTVGTDMSVGKMSTSLEIYHSAKTKGIKTEFVATGQGGLAIVGQGIPLDAVRVDFAAGAVEGIVMKLGQKCELLLIEGQGSLIHPGSTATLPLIRGSQPTGLILVHRAGQKHIRNLPQVLIPPLPKVVKMYENVASAGGSFGQVPVKAIALNTFHLDEAAAKQSIDQTQQLTGLPCTDPVRFGANILLDACFESSTIIALNSSHA